MHPPNRILDPLLISNDGGSKGRPVFQEIQLGAVFKTGIFVEEMLGQATVDRLVGETRVHSRLIASTTQSGGFLSGGSAYIVQTSTR